MQKSITKALNSAADSMISDITNGLAGKEGGEMDLYTAGTLLEVLKLALEIKYKLTDLETLS